MFGQRKYERDNDTQAYLQRKNERDSATQAYLQRKGERENANTVGIAATQKIATRSTDIISAARVAFFSVVNATRNEKSCLQFLIPTAVFHMLLKIGNGEF